MTDTIRTAVVEVRSNHVPEDRLRYVLAYLPANYTARLAEAGTHDMSAHGMSGAQIVVEGIDNAGWTLDDYVIPRLASGGVRAVEVRP